MKTHEKVGLGIAIAGIILAIVFYYIPRLQKESIRIQVLGSEIIGPDGERHKAEYVGGMPFSFSYTLNVFNQGDRPAHIKPYLVTADQNFDPDKTECTDVGIILYLNEDDRERFTIDPKQSAEINLKIPILEDVFEKDAVLESLNSGISNFAVCVRLELTDSNADIHEIVVDAAVFDLSQREDKNIRITSRTKGISSSFVIYEKTLF
jgi:hypothetical protein